MNISEIIGNSIRYPFSDWKKILILGILTVITGLTSIFQSLGFKNIGLTLFSLIALVLAYFLISGYQYRIIKSSLNDVEVPPEFDSWLNMFIDGIKVTLVGIIYLLPGIFIIGFISGILIVSLANKSTIIFILIAILYIIIIIPISRMAIAYMADNGSKFGAAFRFHEILNKISTNGWINFILWYIVTGIVFLMIVIVGSVVTSVIGRLIFAPLGIILTALFIAPYLYMFINRFCGIILQIRIANNRIK